MVFRTAIPAKAATVKRLDKTAESREFKTSHLPGREGQELSVRAFRAQNGPKKSPVGSHRKGKQNANSHPVSQASCIKLPISFAKGSILPLTLAASSAAR